MDVISDKQAEDILSKSTGVFTWKKVHAGVSFGRNAGSNRGGYIVICINRKKYYAHVSHGFM